MWSSIRKDYGKWKWKTFSWVERKMTDCSFQRKKLLSLNAVTNEQHLKGAIARALSLKRKKRKYLGKYEAKTYIFEFTLELQRRINTLEKGPAGWWEPQWSSWGLLPAWFSERELISMSTKRLSTKNIPTKETRAPCALKDCPRMHLVPNMKRHLKKASGSWGDQRSCPTGWRKHRKAGITKLSFPCKNSAEDPRIAAAKNIKDSEREPGELSWDWPSQERIKLRKRRIHNRLCPNLQAHVLTPPGSPVHACIHTAIWLFQQEEELWLR